MSIRTNCARAVSSQTFNILRQLRWGPGRPVKGLEVPADCAALCVVETRRHRPIKEYCNKKRQSVTQHLLMESRHTPCLSKLYSWTLGLPKLDLSGWIGCIHELWLLMPAHRDLSGCNQLYSWTLCLSVGTGWMLDALRVLNQLLRWWGRAPGGLCGWLGSGPKWCDGVQEQ